MRICRDLLLIGVGFLVFTIAFYGYRYLNGCPDIFPTVSNKHNSSPLNFTRYDTQKRNEIFSHQKAERQKFNDGSPEMFALIESIMPQIECPDMVRLGYVGDGGKWVCRPWRHSPNCIVYSLGVGENPTFEQEVVKFTRCQTYSFDPNKTYASLFNESSRMNFHSWHITHRPTSTTDKTVAAVMTILNHTKLDILKIDIEGDEYLTLPNIFEVSKLRQICQILTEVHGRTVRMWRDLLAQYERADYYIFSREPNYGCWTPCIEYAHLHKSCFDQYGIDPNQVVFNNFG